MTSKTNNSLLSEESSSMEVNIRQKIETEKKAFNIVNRLIETGVSADYLLEHGNMICPSHYDDVTEERSISKICGYPLCDNILQSVPKQKFHISSESNKVYDITERKRFCTNLCFKASKFYENQISAAPIWARDTEAKIHFKLLESSRSLVGDEIIGSPESNVLKNEVEQLIKIDTISSKQIRNKGISSTDPRMLDWSENVKSKEEYKDTVTHSKFSSLSQKPTESKSEYMLRLLDKKKNQLSVIADDKPLEKMNIPSCPTHLSVDEGKINCEVKEENNRKDDSVNLKLSSQLSPLDIICTLVKQWVTANTKSYLQQQKQLSNTDTFDQKYTMLCQRLEERDKDQDKLEENFCDKIQLDSDKVQSKPLPDYQQLQTDCKKDQIKVREFYKGNFFTNMDLEELQKDCLEDDIAPVVMPTVDSNDQMIIRRRIVLERLMKIMPDLLSPLKLSIQDITEETRELIQTFSFSNTNITFKPAQWTLVGLIILKMLSRRIPKVKNCFQQSSTGNYLHVILTALGHTYNDLTLIADEIVK